MSYKLKTVGAKPLPMWEEFSMDGKTLAKTRYPLTSFSHERGKVGWAHWRTRTKAHSHRNRRRHLDKQLIQRAFDEEED